MPARLLQDRTHEGVGMLCLTHSDTEGHGILGMAHFL